MLYYCLNVPYLNSFYSYTFIRHVPILGKIYNTKCDIFSFAIVLWEMLARQIPTIDPEKNTNSLAIMFAMVQGKRKNMIILMRKVRKGEAVDLITCRPFHGWQWFLK